MQCNYISNKSYKYAHAAKQLSSNICANRKLCFRNIIRQSKNDKLALSLEEYTQTAGDTPPLRPAQLTALDVLGVPEPGQMALPVVTDDGDDAVPGSQLLRDQTSGGDVDG